MGWEEISRALEARLLSEEVEEAGISKGQLHPHPWHADSTICTPSSSQDHATEVTGRDACSDTAPGEPWDSLHILAPQCEVYVCVGPAEGTER